MKNREVLQDTHREMLKEGLKRIFGTFDERMLADILPLVNWVELSGGEVLFEQNTTEESIYFVISGRLRAATDVAGHTRRLGDIARGETIGEMAFFTGEARMATVTAVRDSVLAHFSKAAFQTLLEAYPGVAFNMMKLVIGRHKRSSLNQQPVSSSVTLGVAAITDKIDLDAAVARMKDGLSRWGNVKVVTSATIEEELGAEPTAAAVSRALDRIEAEYQIVLLIADPSPTAWTKRCLRQCDEVLLFADADQPETPHAIELAGLVSRTLVLVHPDDRLTPVNTRRWLREGRFQRHIHVRRTLARDWNRLARLVSGNAVGLVLSGGGARGLAHLGVIRALEEAGVEVDLVAGTSIGAVMAAYAAMDMRAAEMTSQAQEAFRQDPTSDLNLFPLLSLVRGLRLKKAIDTAVVTSRGQHIDIEDLWKGYFCISSNYSLASEAVLDAGPLAKMVRASVSIPGALPPVVLGGDLHVDGGAFNNFPVDVMYRKGAHVVLGVSLPRDQTPKVELDELPGLGTLLWNEVRGIRSGLPSLTTILFNAAMINSLSRQYESRGVIDLYFSPPVLGYDILGWKNFGELVEIGLVHGREVLASMPASLRDRLQARVPVSASAIRTPSTAELTIPPA